MGSVNIPMLSVKVRTHPAADGDDRNEIFCRPGLEDVFRITRGFDFSIGQIAADPWRGKTLAQMIVEPGEVKVGAHVTLL